MQIHQRINARKLMLSYLYQYCFFSKLALLGENVIETPLAEMPTLEQSDPFFDKEFLEDIRQLRELSAQEGVLVQARISDVLETPVQEEIPYYLKHFFDKWKEEEVDVDYLLKIGSAFLSYTQEVKDIVNTYTATFQYDQMDIVDQAIFLLGYTEHKTLATPKEILINEMIELAKRYSDDGAPKLINGIMHNFLNTL